MSFKQVPKDMQYGEKYTSEFNLGEQTFKLLVKQKTLIASCCFKVNQLDYRTIRQDLQNYYSALLTFYMEIKAATRTVNHIERVYDEKEKKFKNVNKGLVVFYIDGMFKKYHELMDHFVFNESKSKEKLMPNVVIDHLMKIQEKLYYVVQWDLGLGIVMSKEMSDKEKLSIAIGQI